jgi:hypothetical protein
VFSILFSDEVGPIEEGTDPEGRTPSGSLISRSGFTPLYLEASLPVFTVGHEALSDPLQIGASLFASSSARYAMTHEHYCSRFAVSEDKATYRVYLVSSDVQSGGYRTDGVRDSNIRRRCVGNDLQYMTCKS